MLELGDVDRDELWQHETNGFDFIRLFFPNVSIFIAEEITQVAQMIPGPGPMENTTILHFLHPTPPESDDVAARRDGGLAAQRGTGGGLQCRPETTTGLRTGLMKSVLFGRMSEAINIFIVG